MVAVQESFGVGEADVAGAVDSDDLVGILGDAALQLMGMGAADQVAHGLLILEKRSVHNGDY